MACVMGVGAVAMLDGLENDVTRWRAMKSVMSTDTASMEAASVTKAGTADTATLVS